MYNVTLSNRDAIFDHETGFRTAKDAIRWAKGRGGSYVAHIENKDTGATQHFSIDGRTVSVFDGLSWSWKKLKLAEIGNWI